MKKAYSYARVSTGKQRDGISTNSQHDRNEKDCLMLGFEVVKTFTEIESGKDDNRPILQKIFVECQRRARTKDKIELLAIHDWDRWFRNTAQSAIWVEKFKQIGVCVNSPQPHLWVDSEDAGSILLQAVRSGLSHAESLNISKRTKRCLYYWKLEGYYPHRPPRGFVHDGKDERGKWMFKPDPELGEKYTFLYQMIATGIPAMHAYLQLGGRKVFGAKQTFLDNLRNPVYAGKIIAKTSLAGYEQKLVDAKFKGLIHWDVFTRAMDVMDGKFKVGKTKESDSLFPAKRSLLCPTCLGHVSSDMPHKKNAGGMKVYHYYRCIKNQKHYRISKEKVDMAIGNMLPDLTLSETSKTYLLDKLKERTDNERRSIAAKLSIQKEKLAVESDRMAMALKLLVDGTLSRSEYDTLLKGKSEIETDIQKLEGMVKRMDTVKMIFNSILNDFNEILKLSDNQKLTQLLRMIFPEGFVLDGLIFRTNRINSIFLLLPEKQRLWKSIEVNQSLFVAESVGVGAMADHFRTDLEAMALFVHQFKAA